MTLAQAQRNATEIVSVLVEFCLPDRCEIAGSIRRRCLDPGDIEIVAVPDSRYLREIRAIVNNRWGEPELGAFPSKYTRVRGGLCNIDFFWCTNLTFGLNYFIRTGSAEFVRRALCHWKERTQGGFSHEARLYPGLGMFPLKTPTEQDVFEALGWDWIAPEKRV